MAFLEVDAVSKVFGIDRPLVALRDVSITAERGEFLCLLGPSGCGKSTLLEIIAGLQPATRGDVWLDGARVTGPSPINGVVFQDASLFPWRTTARNVEFGLALAGVPRAERRARVREALDAVGLAGFEDAYPHQLSGGMRQRAGIARALVRDPEVLLMDEPFGALDHLTRLRLQDDLLALWREHRRTVVFVTHDVGEAVYLADRIALLSPRPGRLEAIFDVGPARPRRRDDPALIELQAGIYAALNGAAVGA